LHELDPDLIAHDLSRLVQAPSVTGDERAALELLAVICAERGLEVELHEHDLDALRALPGHPGEEAERSELVGLTARVAGAGPRRLCINGHVDVVGPGEVPWQRGPWSGAIEDGHVHGRGSIDMKGGVIAAVHAMAALRDSAPCEIVLQAVAGEEDGGQGTFAALELDDGFDACLIPEPTGFRVVCAQAGALTFKGVVGGRAAHAAFRLEGESALDRYVQIHLALQQLERDMNANVEHPLMAELALPYPLLVGKVHAGRWSSVVPDRLEFEGRVGVPLGTSPADVRELVERTAEGAEITWTGGQFAPAETPVDHPFAQLVQQALSEELGRPAQQAGMPYGADMRLFTERGIPCVMAGPGGLELLHAVDERVPVAELVTTARVIARVASGFA
jgi:acetylornithine deacetylase